jgi:hypothetical protein
MRDESKNYGPDFIRTDLMNSFCIVGPQSINVRDKHEVALLLLIESQLQSERLMWICPAWIEAPAFAHPASAWPSVVSR